METTTLINALINDINNGIKKIYKHNDNDYGITFPKYSDRENKQSKIRRSEQELRFIFIEQFLKYRNSKEEAYKDLANWHYSVETPTYFRYTSAWRGNPSIEGKRSGKIDLTLYENDNPAAFIEFKYGSLGKDNKNLEYDVIKLVAESIKHGKDCRGYSLNLIETKADELSSEIFDEYIGNAIEKINKRNCEELSDLKLSEVQTDIKSRIEYISIILSDKHNL